MDYETNMTGGQNTLTFLKSFFKLGTTRCLQYFIYIISFISTWLNCNHIFSTSFAASLHLILIKICFNKDACDNSSVALTTRHFAPFVKRLKYILWISVQPDNTQKRFLVQIASPLF